MILKVHSDESHPRVFNHEHHDKVFPSPLNVTSSSLAVYSFLQAQPEATIDQPSCMACQFVAFSILHESNYAMAKYAVYFFQLIFLLGAVLIYF